MDYYFKEEHLQILQKNSLNLYSFTVSQTFALHFNGQ